jgi:hypothetical protein
VLQKNHALSSASQKVAAGLSPKYLGPCKVQIAVNYELEYKNGKLSGNWHVKDLEPYHARS